MATPTYKAAAIARELTDRLKVRFSDLAISETVATDGCPLIRVGALTAGTRSFILKVANIDWPLAQDALGNTAIKYGPHLIQLATEANNAGGAGADVLARQDMTNLLWEVFRRKCTFEWYEEANGTPPANTTLGDATKLKAKIADMYWPHDAQ